jgi:hypothetical protein
MGYVPSPLYVQLLGESLPYPHLNSILFSSLFLPSAQRNLPVMCKYAPK